MRIILGHPMQGQLLTYSGGKVRVQEDPERLSLDLSSWSLLVSSSRATDTGIYSCVFNKQASDRNVVQLLVLGETEMNDLLTLFPCSSWTYRTWVGNIIRSTRAFVM